MFGYLVDIRVETKFEQKNSLSNMSTLFPNLDKKSQISRFGRDLAAVWNIQIFGYLNI
jgi:hypothetical protein